MSQMISADRLRLDVMVVLIGLLGVPGSARAFQAELDAGIDPIYAAGTHAFRNILHRVQQEHQMEVLPSIEALAQGKPNRTAIVILGDLPDSTVIRLNNTLISGGLPGFVMNAGALFVASDEYSKAYHNGFGVTINGTLLRNPFSRQVFSNLESMPLVQPAKETNGEIPVFEGLHVVATNLPSYLELEPNSPLTPLAHLPKGTIADDGSAPLPGGSLVFAAGGIYSETHGRALFLADHSVFINCMLLQDEDDNAVFANRCLEWLVHAEGDAPERNRILYLENGEPVTNLNVSLQPGLLFDEHSVDQLVHGVDGFIAGQEQNDTLDRWLQRIPRKTWLAIAAIGGSVVTLLLVLQRLSLRRFRAEPGVELFSVAALRYGPSRLPLRDRTAEMHREGKFSDAARGVLQQFFMEVAPPGSTTGTTRPPTVRPRGQPAQEARLNSWLRDLWHLAYGPPQSISAARFQNVLGILRMLRQHLSGWQLHYSG